MISSARTGLLSVGLPLVVSVLVFVACAETLLTPEDIKGPTTWGATNNVTHHGNLWFSGQPDRAGLEAARRAGVSVVVNLRHPTELDWDERAAAEALGLSYFNIPVAGSEPLSRETFAAIDAVVADHESEQILVHCSSSNRVGAWFAAHLVKHRGMPVEDALRVGRATGLTKEPLVENLRAHLERRLEEPSAQ